MCGVMTLFNAHAFTTHVNGYDGDFVRQMCMVPYNLQHYISRIGHHILDSLANHSYREHRSVAFSSLHFYSQMDVADK